MNPDQKDKNDCVKPQEGRKFEEGFLKGEKDENIGVYCDLFSAKSNINGQDGGIVSSLLSKGLNSGVLDSAVIVCRGQGYSAEAKTAASASEVLRAAGTRYLKVNVTKKLRELIKQGKKKIVVVCTPCEAKAARKIQQTHKDKCDIAIVGLFCFEAFNKDKLRREVKNQLGVDIDKAQKTQVRAGIFSASVDGKNVSCSVKNLEGASERVCGFCDDFTARFSDVSVGGVGSKEGYSTVIVRSDVGERLLRLLKAEIGTVEIEEVRRIAKSKKTRAKKNLVALKNPK